MIQKLESDPGIISVETVEKFHRRKCKLKVVYFEKNIPEGIKSRVQAITGKKVKK